MKQLLWPLFQQRHFASPDLQRLLTWAVSMRLERLPCKEAFSFMQGVWRAIFEAGRNLSMVREDAAKAFFAQQLQSHFAFGIALTDACKRTPQMVEKVLVDLASAAWMSKDVCCHASMRLVHNTPGLRLDVEKWHGLLAQCSGASRVPELLLLALQSLRPVAQLVLARQ